MKKWPSALRRNCARRRGAAAVEFALVLPAVVLLVFGIFESGRALWIMHSMQEALNITGRYAIYNPNVSNAQLQTYFGQNIAAVPSTAVTLTFAADTTGTVPFTTITATYQFVPVTSLTFTAITLSSSTRVPRI